MRGTIRERQPGVWELRVYVGRDPVSKRPRQVSRTVHGGKRAAQSALAKLVTEAEGGRYGGTRSTMGLLFDRWIEAGERQRLAPNTIRARRSRIETHLRPALGDRPVSKVTTAELNDLYSGLKAKGLSDSMVNHIHAVLASCFEHAIDEQWITDNPARRASPPKKAPAPIVIPTPAEVHALVAAAEPRDPNLAALLFLAAITGARRGELCALRWRDIDLERRRLTISRSLTDVDGGWLEKAPKTKSGVRTIGLDDAAVALLTKHRSEADDRARVGLTRLTAAAFVFSTRLDGGEPYRPQNVSQFFERIRKVAGVDHVHLHHLRHFTAAELIGAGFDARTVANRLGHASPSITLNVYSHLFEARDRDAAEHMGRVLAPPPAAQSLK